MRRRTASLAAAGTLALAAYVALAVAVWRESTIVAATYRSAVPGAGTGGQRPLGLYVDVLAVDPVREELDVRVDFSGGAEHHGTRYFGTADRTVDVRIGDGDSERRIRLTRGAGFPSVPVAIDLTGSVAAYPFDRYAGHLYVRAGEIVPGGGSRPLPVAATVWPGLGGWSVRSSAAEPDEPGELALSVDVTRPSASRAFALTIVAVIAVLALSAAAMTATMLLGRRPLEVSFANLFAAMLVALPLLRAGMPGAPPIGTRADLAILLWAEVVVALALGTVVTMWIREADRS